MRTLQAAVRLAVPAAQRKAVERELRALLPALFGMIDPDVPAAKAAKSRRAYVRAYRRLLALAAG